MKSLTFTITEEDIKNGRRFSAFSCPIALAVNRQYPALERGCVVGLKYLNHGPDRKRTSYTLDDDLENFVKNFDNNIPVKAGTYTVKRIPNKKN
jgi:hypothetical protein